MATIIKFSPPTAAKVAVSEHFDTQGDTSRNFMGLIAAFQGDPAEIRAHFLMVQKNLDCNVAAETDPKTN